MSRFHLAFGALVLAQVAHSVEEYIGRLWETFPPARILPALISQDLSRGFLLLNVFLVVFGVWCWLWPIRRGLSSAAYIAWGWVVVELVNGTGHLLWALARGGYVPGLITAPLLLLAAWNLARRGGLSGSPRLRHR
jgi:hypothetical protein